MDSPQIGLLIALIILIVFSALFSASETAITGMNVIRMKNLAKQGNAKAKFIYECSEKITVCITSILIANNIVNILASGLTTALFTTWFGVYGVAYATIVMTILILIFGEITPKVIAREHPETTALALSPVLKITLFIFHPLAKVVDKMQGNFIKEDESVTATEDELLEIVSTIEQEGVLEQEERELIENVIEFNDTSIKEIMVKKEDVVFVYDNVSYSELRDILKQEKFSRIPVLSFERNEVIGILKIKDIFDCLLDNQPIVVTQIMKKPIFVPKRKKLPEILESIQKSREHIAIVVDNMKSKNYLGIITLEDILEELVGEIYDEHDHIPKDVIEIGNHSFLIKGDVQLKMFFERYTDIELPNTESRDFKQWIFELAGNKKVRKNKELAFENLYFTILETKDGFATKLELEINTKED